MTPPGSATVHNHSLLNSLRLLLTRRFGSFWAGSLLSNLGTWMQQVAEPWLILSLSGSSFLLGLDAFANPDLDLQEMGGCFRGCQASAPT